jgi:hypothetical protein
MLNYHVAVSSLRQATNPSFHLYEERSRRKRKRKKWNKAALKERSLALNKLTLYLYISLN